MSKILHAFALLLLTSQMYANEPIFVDSPEDAFALAQETKQEVLLIFTADWCHYCKVLKGHITDDPSMVSKLIVCFVDYDYRSDLVKEFNVKIIPDSFLYKDKIERKRKTGFKSKNDYIEWLKK